MAKPKKGVMPAGLKRYWAAKRSKKTPLALDMWAARNGKTIRRVTKKKRQKNPVNTFRLLIKKAGQTLYLNEAGDKFVKTGRAKLYATPTGAKAAAQSLARRYAMLKGWDFYASP